MKLVIKNMIAVLMIFIFMNSVKAENIVPSTCTETGTNYFICKHGESYDASTNSCWSYKGLRQKFENKIISKDGGYNDYFVDYDSINPTNRQCPTGYVFGYDSKQTARCFKTVCDDGYRSGENCIQCAELVTSASPSFTPGGQQGPWNAAGAPVDCSAFKELTAPIWKWMKIIAPIIAVTLGTFDLLKAVAADDDKGTKKAVADFGKRLALTALLFLLPVVVNFLVGLIEFKDISACL